MLQNGVRPSFAIPAENVTACPSAIPTSKTLSGISFIIMFIEHPDGIAGVTPTMFGFCLASSRRVFPNTSCNSGGIPSVVGFILSPVILSNFPGACHSVAHSSAGLYPLPFTVCMCNSFGPLMSFISFRTFIKEMVSCPSIGPKYLIFKPSKMFCCCMSNDFRLLLNRIMAFFLSSVSNPHLAICLDIVLRKRL